MDNYDLRYDEDRYSVAAAPVNARAAFIRRTYGHLAGAVLGFVAIEAALLNTGLGNQILSALFGIPYGMLLLMVAFIGGGYLAQYMARSATSDVARYAGLALFVGLQALIFLPILTFAELRFPGERIALQAGVVTLVAFAGLTAIVAFTAKDFSFLGPILGLLSFAALGVIIASILFGFGLGIVFSAAMVVLAGGYILYDTSNIMHHYREDQHVAAALELFSSVALMFYYILRIFLAARSN